VGAGHPAPHLTIILVLSETLPLSSVKTHLSEIVDRVEGEHDRVVVTRNGKPAAVLETLGAIASDPRRPDKPLRFELEGCRSARRGPYRVIYRIDDTAHTVSVLAVAHRADIYRPR
jgi:mRNA interferase RelE/StbE